MRLIDAEKLKENCKITGEQETILSDVHQGFNAGLSMAIQIVKGGGVGGD